MSEHRWAPPEHQDVPVYAAASLPLDEIGNPEPVDPPEPVTISRLVFDQIGELVESGGASSRRGGTDGEAPA